ncbi:hypothetical protein OC842_004164 [Tilletia horrida]|uniref:Uncharacterized protein n=1 Tax=Tilletia horrida TaxID=155126 RepID=A0AAN6GAC6_9BASI|nr:hypothetical protein OC842_004164 [Tilletia horrida]KAK0556630.1 hypothetical protein OC844_005808 [Tilletia horrida]
MNAEIEDCLQLAATLDDEMWDDMDDEAIREPKRKSGETQHAQIAVAHHGNASPSKRRKTGEEIDHANPRPHFKPYVIDARSNQPHPAPTAPRNSAGRFVIPAEERAELGLAAADYAGLGLDDEGPGASLGDAHAGAAFLNRAEPSSDHVEDFPSSDTAFTLRTHGPAASATLAPLALGQDGTAATSEHSRQYGRAHPPRTPQADHNPGSPSLGLCFSSPLGTSSPRSKTQAPMRGPDALQAQTGLASNAVRSISLGRSLARVQDEVQAALQQSLGCAQKEWEKERQAFLRKLDAKDKTIKCLREKLSGRSSSSH